MQKTNGGPFLWKLPREIDPYAYENEYKKSKTFKLIRKDPNYIKQSCRAAVEGLSFLTSKQGATLTDKIFRLKASNWINSQKNTRGFMDAI